ncbi:5-carboxymethyl-2-hydroxymuconate Delta-isomerase [Hydrogenibacillus schlegelii]|uniref:5-carboxymethyl-2-hydroxymuconate Delta-isomerase n=1 Tax=Hydrogenibacillus schlegelii TaxID=1484 RepID=UPI00082656C5
MPHVIVEYSANLEAEGDIPGLLRAINRTLLGFQPLIPIGGLRTRAYRAEKYVVADGTADDAFVHVTILLGRGRTEADRWKIGEAVFQTLKGHFAGLYARRYLALSLTVEEFSPLGTFKHNNIHARYASAPAPGSPDPAGADGVVEPKAGAFGETGPTAGAFGETDSTAGAPG